MQSSDFRGRSSTPAVLPRHQPLVLPPPIHQMPRPLTNSDRDAVRADFVRCYDAIKDQKDLLLSTDDGAVQVAAQKKIVDLLVSGQDKARASFDGYIVS